MYSRWRSADEYLQIAQYLHLSEEAFVIALEHLASLNILHYYPWILPNVMHLLTPKSSRKVQEQVEFHVCTLI